MEEKTTMSYKRLTKSGGKFASSVYSLDTANFVYGDDIIESQNEGLVQQLIERLAELEDKIENGTLIELPCKVGDTVWFLNKHYAIYLRKDTVYKAKVVRVYFEKNKNICLSIQIKTEYGTTKLPRITEIGKTVFFTKPEAEKKLKELQKDD